MVKMATQMSTQELFDSVRRYIQDAQEIMDRGEFIELDGMDERVSQLCDAIMAMPQDRAAAYADELQEIMQELEQLQTVFEAGKAKLADELAGVTQHKQASTAYNNSTLMAARASAKKPSDD